MKRLFFILVGIVVLAACENGPSATPELPELPGQNPEDITLVGEWEATDYGVVGATNPGPLGGELLKLVFAGDGTGRYFVGSGSLPPEENYSFRYSFEWNMSEEGELSTTIVDVDSRIELSYGWLWAEGRWTLHELEYDRATLSCPQVLFNAFGDGTRSKREVMINFRRIKK